MKKTAIPGWEVQQAYPIEKYPLPQDTEFWLTQKLNGVRATFYRGKLYARSGAAFAGLDHIENALRQYSDTHVLDGELTLLDKGSLSDNEAFRTAAGMIRSGSAEKTQIGFTVFDMLPISAFENGENVNDWKYSRRRALMDSVASSAPVSVLPILYHGSDQSVIPELLDRMTAEDKEGLMLNTDCPYRRKRHSGILKVKRFYTMDLKVVGSEEGAGKLTGTLGALVLAYKNGTVCVGTGFTDEQREALWNFREQLPGTICEIKYKEISHNKAGTESLQFPSFVALRFDKTTVSYG